MVFMIKKTALLPVKGNRAFSIMQLFVGYWGLCHD